MKETGVFLFGVLNFFTLVLLLFFVFRRPVRDFLYSRQVLIKKEMVNVSRQWRDAKQRALVCRKKTKDLTSDIEERKKAIAAGCEKECSFITEEAERRANTIIEGATRLCVDERRKAIKEIEKRIIENAFFIAKRFFVKSSSSDVKKNICIRSLDEIENGVKGGDVR